MSNPHKLGVALAMAGIVAGLILARGYRAGGQAVPLTMTGTCPAAQVGSMYYCEIKASGGTPPYKWGMPAQAVFGQNYPGLKWAVTGENNSILVIYGVPTQPNDGSPASPGNFTVKPM